jgi:hypothetical protein
MSTALFETPSSEVEDLLISSFPVSFPVAKVTQYNYRGWPAWLVDKTRVFPRSVEEAVADLRSMGIFEGRFEQLESYPFNPSVAAISYVLVSPNDMVKEEDNLLPLDLYDIYNLRKNLNDTQLKQLCLVNEIFLVSDLKLSDHFDSPEKNWLFNTQECNVSLCLINQEQVKPTNGRWCLYKIRLKNYRR